MSERRVVDEETRKRIEEALKRGKIVVIQSGKEPRVKGDRVEVIVRR